MAIRDVFKISFRTYFDPVTWVGYNNIKESTSLIGSIIKSLFTPAKPERIETFEAALKRLKIPEAELKRIAERYLTYTTIFVILAGLAFSSSFYLLFSYGSFAAWLVANLVALLFFVEAFRYHFWYFQIKQRKFGCSSKEWWNGKIKNKKGSKP